MIAPLDSRPIRRRGLDVRRTDIGPDDWAPWGQGRPATPQRMALDPLLDRPLPDAVADLDAVLRARFVSADEIRRLVAGRSDNGIVAARRAVGLTDPRAESRPESRVRVWLVLDGLMPEP
ncbi:hypothetical protein [Pseudonocardia sp. H11422]|uniref:hypothetical protein n=1 Tax=Pseudonocardia sp. H11422 TaxID=2835866 RepID=UPI001BDCF073|nr:hypothetical protein [Pseudonocardia sp. H11422]